MRQRHLYGGLLAVIGLVLAVLQTLHGLQQPTVPVAQAVDVLPFAVSGLAVAYTGYWLATETDYEADTQRVFSWALGGALVFASVAALLLFNRNVAGGTLDRAAFVAVDNVTIGVLSGVLVGLYDARSRARMRDLRAERDRVESFAQKAADVNNYGRAISKSSSIEEITAYAIEGVETLTGFYETVVIELDDEGASVLGSTWVGVEAETARDLAWRGLDQDEGEALFHDDDLSGSLDDVNTVLVSLVARLDGSAVVLLSVSHSDADVAEEDVQLLELLVSHAAAALERLSDGRIAAGH
jgi:hypothetical protein